VPPEGRSLRDWWRSIGVFVLAVGLIVSAFMIAALAPLVRAQAISDSARGIRENALPSIRALLAARAELVSLTSRVERYIGSPPEPALRREIERSSRRLREHTDDYLGLPTYPGEREAWDELTQTVDRVTAASANILRAYEAGDQAGARALRAEFDAPVDRAFTLLSQGIAVNADQVHTFAATIESARRAAWRDALVLSGLCILLTVALVSLAWLSARRQRAAEAQYAKLLEQRAGEMDVFARRVAHDILSPLSSVSLALGQLAESEDERVRRLATRGLSGLGRTRSTVEGLLEFARAGGSPPRAGAPTDVAVLARETLAELEDAAQRSRTELRLELEGSPPKVSANRGVVTSVLTNIVQNAIKHAGGAPVVVRLRGCENRLRVEVADRGPGLEPELREKIFDEYFRAPRSSGPGLGLGLATTKRLVESHGGAVGVRSRHAGGCVFWFELPAEEPAADADSHLPAPLLRPQPAP
jgi:signal transduction histidine kinase